MPTISFSGLSSGIDTSGWVDALVSVRQQTITSLQEQQEAQEALLNVVNEIKSYFSSFQSCLSKITDSQFGIPTMDLFMQNLAVSSNTNIATATATTEAARQSYDVVVDSLATATKATSGYNQYEVKYATLDTQIGLLGAKNGTITVNQQSFSVTTEDTIRSLIQKFQNVGVSAEFNEQKGTFTVGVSLSEIDEGATNIKSALKLQDNTVSGAISGSLVYADRDTEFSKLGLTDGKVMIEGVEHTIAQNGNSYTITKAGGTAADLNTVGDFLDYLMSSAVGAESADVDDMGNISIKGATLDAVTGGSNIIDILNLSETFNRTAMESNRLTYIDVHVADLNTKLSDMGINATTTLTVGGNTHNITQDMTLGDIQNLLAAGNVDFEIDDKGVITIDTKGNEISGTLLDVLGLDPSKNGSTITSTAHQSKYEADGNTLLSDLGVNNSHNYVAYDSEGKALTGNINNVSGKTINELITDLKNAGLDASFDSTSHQIVINDGYIEGTLADALGMNKNTTSYTESATVNTTLEKLGATGNETLTIDGGAAKTYGKDTTLETVLNDIKAAGGDVTFKDGNVTIQGVTLGGTLPALLGLDATTQGTSVTSGALTVVTDSSSSGSDMDATIEHDITLSSKIGDILGTTSNYTLSVDGGAATTYTKDTTLQTLKTQIEAAGGTFTINDDNTISIENVTMSGTLVGALGFDSVENGTRFSTVNPVYIPGATTVANGSTSLDELFGGASGISTFSAAPARAMAAPAAAPRAGGGYTLSIDGGTEISYAAGVTLDDIFADIIAAGGSASIDSDGYIVIDGVHLEGTLVDALGLVETSYGTTITSGNLQVTESMTSTSSSTLMGEKEGNLSWDSTVGSITGDDKSYLMGINGTTHTYATDVKLSDIRDDIIAAGGSMTLNSDNTISITGVSIDGTLATALGFDITDYKTTISSNTPIYAKTEDVEATASTTFNDLGINTNLRDYAIYLPDGTIVKASSEAGSSGTATIGDWLNQINSALNTANGTSGQTYAKIENGVISITGGGYVTGSLPTALGMLTEEVITGTTMVGSPISYIEYEPLKYITSIQNGTGESGKDITYTGSIGNATNQSGTAADGVTSDGLIGPEDEFVDLFGNITDATLNATLSELLTPGASDPLNNDARLPADSYTLKIGSYATKTFDSDTTTLQDVIDYVDTLKTYDPTYDMAFDAYLSGNKLVIKTDMDISGTLADVIGLTKVKTEDEYYTYVAKNIQYTALVEGASNGFNFSIVGDKVYYDKTETGTKDGYEYTGESISTTTTKTYVSSLSGFVSGETYYIKDANDLNKLAELVDAGKDTTNVSFILENDIDMSSVTNFAGIGRVIDTAFKGNFYGNGHVIKNVTMNLESASQFVGFFGQTSGATIQDVGLENVNITSRHCAPSSFVGALIGKAFNTTIINSYVDGGTIDSSADYTAGLVACMSGASNLITNSWATVDISITSTTFAMPIGANAGLTVGGLVGEFSGGTIKNSFSSSNITGSARASAGGLIGHLSGSSSTTITNVYADGDVSSSSSGVNVGGLIGFVSSSGYGTITNAFYSGSTLSGTNVGGFIGASGGGLNILNSAYNSAANANAISGGSLSGVNPMTMESMTNQATMEGLGFTSDNGWVYTPGATPHLANATVTTIGVSLTTSTTIGQLFGDTNSHTLTVQVEGGSSKNITFSSTDTVQSVIDKLAAEGIDASVTADHRFKVFDELRWTLSGDVATKLFGGSGNDVYTYTGNKVTYTETVVTPGAGGNYNYTGESIQWEETITNYVALSRSTTLGELGIKTSVTVFDKTFRVDDTIQDVVNYLTSSSKPSSITNFVFEEDTGIIKFNFTGDTGSMGSFWSSFLDESTSSGYYQFNIKKTYDAVQGTPNPDSNGFITEIETQSITGLTHASTASSFTAGNTYLVSNKADLMALNGKSLSGVNIVLGADIDLEGEKLQITGFENGTFYGNGYTISGMTSSLFADFDANIQDVKFSDFNIDADRYGAVVATNGSGNVCNIVIENGQIVRNSGYDPSGVGAVFGTAAGGRIFGVAIKDNVTIAGYEYVGGLVGEGYVNEIEASYSEADVTGSIAVGGLIGYGHAYIFDSFVSGDIISSNGGAVVNTSFGGLIGSLSGSSSLDGTYFSGTVAAGGGALIGISGGPTITIENTVWNSVNANPIADMPTHNVVMNTSGALSLDAMKDPTRMEDFNFTSTVYNRDGELLSIYWVFEGGTPTLTTRYTAASGSGSTSTTTETHDMTTSTTIGQLFEDSNSHTLTVKVEGGSAKNITFSSTDTVQTVIDKLGAEGITASVTSDHKFRVEADNRWTLSGEMAPKLFGGSGNQVYTCTGNKITYDETTTTPGTADPDGFIDTPDIHTPPSGGDSGGGTTTITEYYYQGSKVTYGGTSGTGYAASTKISDIRSSAVGTRWYVISDNYTGSTTGFVGQSAMFRYIDINANTTIQDVVDFFNSSAGVQSASYSTLSGEMSVTTQNGYQFHCSGVPYSIPVELPAEGSGQTTPGGTYKVAFGKSAGTPASTATLTTKLSDLGTFLPAGIGFSVTNNGATTDLTFSSTDTISTVVNKLNSLGLEASFLNGALRVSSSYSDFQITKTVVQNNFVNKLFGGSLPSIQTNTTTIDPNAITESTTLGELGITSGTLSNNGISLVGGSVPTRTFTSDNTLGDVFSYLEAGGATVTLNTDGTVSITGNAELSGDLLGQLGITLTSSKKTAVISSLTLTYGEKNLALSDRLSTLGLSGSYTIGTNGTTVLANSTVSNLLAALNGLNTSTSPSPGFGTVGGIGGGNIEGFHGGEYKNVSYDPTTGILEFTITGSGSAAYMPAGTLFSALNMVSRVQATDGSYDTTYQYRLTKPGTNVTTATTLKQIFGDTSTTTHTIKVNGQTGTFSSTDNMGDVIDWLNANVGTASLSAGHFSLEYTPTGSTGLLPGNMQGDLGLWISLKSAKGYETETVYNGTLTKVSGSTSGAQYVSDVDSFVSGNTYLIKSVDDLNKLASLVNNGADTTNVSFILENDIDMSSVANFAGIGTYDSMFKGSFYGNGHVIKNLKMNSSAQYVGLFGYTRNATIQDVGLENVNITSTCTSTPSMTGALIAFSVTTDVKNVYVDGGSINSSTMYTGGLIGYISGEYIGTTASAPINITNSYSDVNININSSGSPSGHNTGGLIGASEGAPTSIIITNSFSSSDITGNSQNVGGLIGLGAGVSITITNAYADGNVSSTRTGSNVGGLIGQVQSGSVGTITNAFYSGSTLSGTNVGGFIGTDATSGGGLNILNSAYNSAANANAVSGGSLSGVNSMTMEQLTNQTIMQNMGFTSANGWVYTSGLTPHFGNMTGSAGSTTTVTKDATLSTTVGQLIDGYTTGTIIVNGGSNISVNSSTTIQDIIDKFNDQGIIATWNNGKISLEASSAVSITENNGLINKLFGSSSVSLTGSGGGSDSYTMETSIGSGGSTTTEITHDANLNTTVGQLVDGYSSGTITVSGGTNISVNSSTTIQDIIDKFNDQGIIASWNNGQISLESGTTVTISDSNGLISKLFGTSSITLNPISSVSGSYTMDKVISGTGTTTNTYTMDASTTIGDLFGDSNSHTFTVNGNDITLSADKTVQDLINALAGYGVTATINDGKMTIGSNSDSLLTVSGDLANKVLGKTGSGSVSVDYETVEKTLSLSTTMSELFWDTNSHDFVITKENGSKTTISLSGNQTVQDLITKLQANGIVATLDSSGKLTFKSNYKWSVSGDLGNKVTEGVMNLTVTPLYTFESEELETYTGHQTVSQMLNSGQTLITGNRYHIASVDDLKALATFVNERGLDTTDIDFVLDGDLNLAGVSGLVPIGTQANAFKGNFYGNGHTISNLKISSTGNFVGLFGKVDGATIRDLGLENVDISGGSHVGALTGYAVDSTIENVYSTGKVTGTGDQVGGLIGDVNSSNVKNVYSTAEVEGNTNVGGLIGHLAHYSVLENVYATGDVRSSASQAGGLVGGVRYGGTIKNAYATGDVYGTQSLGGLVGLFEGVDGAYTYTLDTVYSTGRVVNGSVTGGILLNSGALLGNFANGAKVTLKNAVYNSNLEMAGIGSGSASGLTGLTYVEMQDASRMQGLGFTTAKGWKYISDKMTPVLNSVVVDNAGRTYSGEKLYVRGLTEFEAGDTYYIGTKEDLIRLSELVNAGEDTTGSVFILDGDIDMSGVDFAPIGNTSNAFRGDFYGNGHEISNLTINNTTTDRTGLFGVLDGAHIQDLAIVNANVKGNGSNTSYVGILASEVYDDAVIENVYTTGSVSNGFDVGGLVGSNKGTITKSYSTATVSGSGSVGGLVGNNAAGAVIKLSYATGNVLSGVNAGGFAGFNSGTIESSYATGRVNGSSQTGGFVGYNGATITNSYATGFVDEGTKKGGFAGNNAGTITGAVYNQSTKLNAAGSGSSSGITGLELSQMWEKDTMEGLGFTADKGWNYTDNTTPFLNTNNTMVNGDKTYVRDAQSFDSGEVFYIGTAQDLQHLAELVNNGAVTTGVTFVLDADITMSGTAFESIGTSAEKFNGVFMGNGHTISGLTTGLFGDVENAIIRDVGLENVNINATANSTGALAGSAEGTTEIVNSYAKGTITSSKSNIGGLVGSLNSTSSIKSSYAEVNVTGSASVGGLVGLSAGTIENSSATGTVKASSSTAGGFVGRTTGGSITNSFAAGNVTASSAAGGFVGSASGTTITGSYAAGIVSGGSGFIGSISGSNSFSGNVYNNANSAGAGGGTGVSIDDIKSQSKMEALGFTSDKGWVYYEGQAPQLRGKDTSKSYTVDASLDSILANLGSTTISKDITVEVNGTTQTKHFNDTDTVQDVMDWLNGISGVTAVFDEATSKLTISTDDGEMNVTGGLANTLFGGYANKVLDKITQNTDSSHLMAAGSDAIITEDTTVKQLLNSNNSASIGYIDEDGSTVMESFDPDQTLKEVLDWLNAHGFNASITNGVFTAVKEDGSQTDLLGAIGSALKGVDGTTTSTPSGYVSDELTSTTGEKATGTTQLSALGIDSGNIHIQDASGKIVQTIQINNNMTVNDVATLLSAYGITMSINDGKVTVATDGPVKLVDGSSNMVSQMQLDNWIETKSKLTNTSTVAEMGFSQGASLGVIIDGRPTTISFRADDTLDDIITRLKTLGIEASVDADGKFTATSDKGFMLTDELGVYLTQNSVDGYVNFANGYKSDKPLESPGNSTILTEDSLVGDILGTGEGGILRLTLDENNVVDLQYNADDTMQDIMVDLAAYGIETQIKNGVLTAVNLNRTFSFSGDIGKAISGNTPLYENIETGYISKDLSYETVETANMNSTMKELGILGGQIHILNSEGGMVTTLEVDESFTVSQIRSMLSPYGFNLTMDSNGKVSMTSSEGYSVSDGTSNLAAVMGLDNWNQTTEKLALDTTISEMGFKDGADLNLFLDGAVMNVLSFDADQTLQDVIFALSAYGIDASVDANGKFSAVSKDHTFIMSSTLGSFLTKGTSGYVNDDTGYQTVEALEEEKPYTVNSSEKLGYEKLMSADSTLASLGYENGGSVIVNLDGGTYYTLSFLGTDTVQDVIYALSPYGITAEVGADGKFNAVSTDHSFTLTGNVGNFLTSGGAYQNEVTGYETDPITFETTEKVTLDTKLSDLGVSHGDLNIMKDGKVTGSTINITDDTTVGQLFNAIKVYGMEGKIMTDTNGDTYIRISADSNTYLADGTANIVSGLGLVEIRQGDFEGNVIYWEDDTDSGLITEDMLLSTLDKNGYIAQGSLIFETGTGDEAVQHIINITADETVGSLIKKFQDAGINASLSNGVIKISSGLDGITFTGGTSGLVNTIGLDIEDVDVYASSSSALTYEGNVHYSAANFATGDTLLSIVNATEGDMSVFVDGVKCTIHVDPNQTFADLFAQISSTVAARTGLNIKAGFLDKEGNIVVNPTDDKNTGIVAFEIEEGHELVIGASNDTTNFATIANLNKTDFNQITGSRSLYRVNVNSLLTESGLYRDGDITEGTFKIGDAEFTIDSTTTLASLIDQINRSQTAYATAYWDTLSGTMVIQSTLTGASLINIEAGTSNFTDIMGFTTVTDTGASALVTSSQTLGKNAVIRINGTTVTATSNVITSDVSRIKGLTINLKDVSEGETVTITVEQDDEAIFNAVSDTIDAYNAMMEALNKELADKSTLGNEALLKLMRNNLKRLMTSSLSGAYVFKNLAAIGISTGEAQDSITLDVTSLMIDKDTFMNALDTDSDAVKALLVGTQTNPGIFLQANNIVESSIKSSGYFSNMIDSLTRNIDRIEEKINKTNDEINKYRDRLERQFHNMELTISGLQNAYSAFLN